MEKKILVIGLGSMGKRRVRNLLALGVSYIAGFDLREDRRAESSTKYNIDVYQSFEEATAKLSYDAFVISVPPHLHHIYMEKAIEMGIPAFIEASVVDDGLSELIKESEDTGVLLAPSCTLLFHPAIQKIKHFLDTGYLGKISNCIYHSGQYLPDWHSFEPVSDYYVSRKETGGAREIVPFEMTWITKVFGFPTKLSGMYKKTIEIDGAEDIDDTYNALMDYEKFMFFLSVDVVSRVATRRLTINADKKQLIWNWDDNMIQVYDAETKEWEQHGYELTKAESGYNKNITEQIYIDELGTFLAAAAGDQKFPNDLRHDHRVLKALYAIEESYNTDQFINL